MKKTMFIVGFLFLGINSYAQTESKTPVSTIETNNDDLFKSIKPADGQPVVFANQTELDEKIDDKIQKIKQQLVENKGNSEKVIYLKKELWRFENAVVITNKK